MIPLWQTCEKQMTKKIRSNFLLYARTILIYHSLIILLQEQQ